DQPFFPLYLKKVDKNPLSIFMGSFIDFLKQPVDTPIRQNIQKILRDHYIKGFQRNRGKVRLVQKVDTVFKAEGYFLFCLFYHLHGRFHIKYLSAVSYPI